MHTPRREAPMPPLEGEVVERQRSRRGLYVNRVVQETPQSARSGCQLPFQGSRGGCAASGRLLGDPGGYEPPLRVRWKPGAGGSPNWRPLHAILALLQKGKAEEAAETEAETEAADIAEDTEEPTADEAGEEVAEAEPEEKADEAAEEITEEAKTEE